ncbi:TRAP transporter substrate-binding protein [Hyphobacterium sp. CCMP332]|uniref:TRAP transporter substrate-binding protein n=1 Tax=Hyphobacterium sp. CCMP332 TaxID=2749086 RepID=UPI0016500638|nr:TRAP transporter substrate-binding protein [Hyphobacterium sp. CCMP332]QNL18805.1 TRAP transporter substrate-binding protein [Hyphobacterium sp. CCMP332]
MDRRDFLSGASIAAASVATACSQGEESSVASPNVQTRRARRLRMVTTWPANFPGLGTAADRVAEFCNTMSSGSLEIQVHAAGEIVGAFEAFDAVATGTADMYHAAEYYWQGKSPAFNFFTAVPMGMTATEIMAWVEFGGGQELWEELGREFGVVAFQAGNSGHQMGGWFKREINTLEDFRGLRMRIPGLGGNVLRELGGAAVALSGGEIYPALQNGTIDATEWVGPWNDLAFGFYREAPYYYGPGFHEPGSALGLGINAGVWDSLEADHQAIIRAACRACNHMALAEYAHQNAIALNVLQNEHGVQLRSFSDEAWLRIGEISEQVVADVANTDAMTRRVYDSYIAARNRGRDWGRISEYPYFAQRERVLGG